MKRIYLAPTILAVAMLGSSANAAINLVLDQNTQTVNAPTSGILDVVFTGEVHLTNGWKIESAFAGIPDSGSDTLVAGFDSAFATWFFGPQSSDYSGAIIDVEVTPTSAGDYLALGPDELAVAGKNPLNGRSFRDAESYEVIVNPVPEPATMVALGLGAAAMLRRRKK
jgi:hypothetical protein